MAKKKQSNKTHKKNPLYTELQGIFLYSFSINARSVVYDEYTQRFFR